MKTQDLIGPALDWAVIKTVYPGANDSSFWLNFAASNKHSEDWALSGPIIERERIAVCYEPDWEVPNWGAWRTDIDDRQEIMGETPLVAAMRCYVASKLGDEVEIPEELK